MKEKNEEAILADQLLAQRIQDGDMLAFEELYFKTNRKVFGLCLKLLHNDNAEADELCQQTFIQVWNKFKQYKGESQLSTWIHRIAVNQCLMHLRKKGRDPKCSIDDETVESAIVMSRYVAEDKTELRLDLEAAIEQLPNGYRKHLLGKLWFGLEHDELAELHKCSTGTSKSQVAKARTKMKKLLKPRIRFSLKPA
jgi:RNA polymerase sigma-70 factor (ECF subfamily)